MAKKKLSLDKLAFEQLRKDKQVVKALNKFAPECEQHKTQMLLVEDRNKAAWIYVCVDCAAEKKLGVTTINRQFILDVLKKMEDAGHAIGSVHQATAAGGSEDVSSAVGSGADLQPAQP
jgi:hypothetical protein